MKIFAFAAALLAYTALTPVSTASAQQVLTSEACQPLTRTNLEACCSAENWREIIRPNDTGFCPPLFSNDNSGRLGEQFADDVGDDASPPDGGNDRPDEIADDGPGDVADENPGDVAVGTPDDGAGDDPVDDITTGGTGNPGNKNPVGQAGEKGMDKENPSTGTRGKSN